MKKQTIKRIIGIVILLQVAPLIMILGGLIVVQSIWTSYLIGWYVNLLYILLIILIYLLDQANES